MRRNGIITLAVMLCIPAANALEPGPFTPCKQAGFEYSEGATICECPSLKAQGGYGTGGVVQSRRLQCQNGKWVVGDEKCAELTGGADYVIGEHRKLYDLYCPRPIQPKT
jgi:hypothetical protein